MFGLQNLGRNIIYGKLADEMSITVGRLMMSCGGGGGGGGWWGQWWSELAWPFSSPLCTASRGAMALWCQTVISSVQGSTISTIAKMSRRFGISKADGTHSSSLPDSRNPRDRTGDHMEIKARRDQKAVKKPRGSQVLPVLKTHPLHKQVCRGSPCHQGEARLPPAGKTLLWVTSLARTSGSLPEGCL